MSKSSVLNLVQTFALGDATDLRRQLLRPPHGRRRPRAVVLSPASPRSPWLLRTSTYTLADDQIKSSGWSTMIAGWIVWTIALGILQPSLA